MARLLVAYERVMKRTLVTGRDECWPCSYATGSHGYPQSYVDGKVTTAHRVVWTYVNGPIPGELTVDHICHNRKCVNPNHLRLLSRSDNAKRIGPEDFPVGWSCKNNHPASRIMSMPGSGKKYCRDCRNEQQRNYRERKRQ